MAYEDNPYRDEDGEPLMDYDDFGADRDPSPEPLQDDVLEDNDDWPDQDRSRTPVHEDPSSLKSKPRKRLIKKSQVGKLPVSSDLDDDDGGDGDEGKQKRLKKQKRHKGEKKGSKYSMRSSSDKATTDGEVEEMWETIAGGDSDVVINDDQEGVRNYDDDNFIDDTGVHPSDRYGSDNEPRSPSHHPQAEEGEEDDEIKDMFKMGKKRKKNEKSPADVAFLVEKVMAELEVTAEEDADLNRQGKPAINKLKKLPLLTDVLSKKQLQQEFLDHGVLTLLKNWLEPLPDGSLPNINIRAAILQILTDFPIDLEQYDRREQLKKSGLGKVIMFLSKSDEETTSNRRLAKELVDKWSRPIFNKSTRFEDMRNVDDERVPFRRPTIKKPVSNGTGMESRDDVDEFSRERKSGQSSSWQHASRPEATPMDFLVRPQSRIDPDEIRARANQGIQDQGRMKMNRKLQQLKAPKKKQLQATKLSVEGRGMVKYL